MLYVTVVILSFQAYNKWIAKEENTVVEAGMQEMGNMEGKENKETDRMNDMSEMESDNHGKEDSHGHEEDSSSHEGSQVNAFIYNDQNNIKIYLKDKTGNPVDKLEVSHEKIFHLVIVDEQLQKYYHLHPERTGEGEFTIANSLPEG